MTIFQNAPGPNANASEQAQWAVDKCDEHIRLRQTGLHLRNPIRLEIESLEHQINGRLTAVIRAFVGPTQIGFGPGGTLDAQTVTLLNPPIMVPDAAGPYIVEATDLLGNTVVASRYREDVGEAVLDELFRIVALTGTPGGAIVAGSQGRTVSTFNPNTGSSSGPLDGNTDRLGVNQTFTNIRNGAGTTNNQTDTENAFCFLAATTTTDQYSHLRRSGFGFDTSSLGTDTINSAILSLHGSTVFGGSFNGLGGPPALGITDFQVADEDSWANSDFENFADTRFASDITLASWTDTDFNDFTLNASGEAHLNGSGSTHFYARCDWDIDDSFGGTWSSGAEMAFNGKWVDFTGTVDDPKLVVDHTATGIEIQRRRIEGY